MTFDLNYHIQTTKADSILGAGALPSVNTQKGRVLKLPTFHRGQNAAFRGRTRFFTMRCGRRWGKTDFGKILTGDRVQKGQAVGIFVPTYKFQNEVYAELDETLFPIKKEASKSAWTWRAVTGGRIDFWSLEDDRAGRGRKYDLAIIDEAAFTNKNMIDIWRTCIQPTLLDRMGQCLVMSTPKGIDPENFFYAVNHQPELGFTSYHAPTAQNPYMPASELQLLAKQNHPLVFRQEYLAEFVDWSGDAFFNLQSMLVNGKPVENPFPADYVFATIDTAVKDGAEHDGTAVCYWGVNKHNPAKHPLTLLDWDIVQIQGAMLEVWLPTVFQNLDYWAKTCKARFGSAGAFIEDKMSGTVLIQQATNRGWPAQAIDSKLTGLGKDGRAISVSGYVYRGDVKINEHALNKTIMFKGYEKNHLLSQVCSFTIGDKDAYKRPDDGLDAFTYGVAIALGDNEGF